MIYFAGQMFDVLRRDNILHLQLVDWSASSFHQVTQAMRNAVYSDSATGQHKLLLRGRQPVNQALQGMSSSL